jgi:uncharacterized protein
LMAGAYGIHRSGASGQWMCSTDLGMLCLLLFAIDIYCIYINSACGSPTIQSSASGRCRNAGSISSAVDVFAGLTIDIPDLRRDYGERRINSVGHLDGRMVIVCWTQRSEARHIISMRKANDREKARYRKRFEEDR